MTEWNGDERRAAGLVDKAEMRRRVLARFEAIRARMREVPAELAQRHPDVTDDQLAVIRDEIERALSLLRLPDALRAAGDDDTEDAALPQEQASSDGDRSER